MSSKAFLALASVRLQLPFHSSIPTPSSIPCAGPFPNQPHFPFPLTVPLESPLLILNIQILIILEDLTFSRFSLKASTMSPSERNRFVLARPQLVALYLYLINGTDHSALYSFAIPVLLLLLSTSPP